MKNTWDKIRIDALNDALNLALKEKKDALSYAAKCLCQAEVAKAMQELLRCIEEAKAKGK